MCPLQNRLQFNRIVLVLLVTICAAGVNIELRKYTKLGPGQNIKGTILAELTSKSKLKFFRWVSKNIRPLTSQCRFMISFFISLQCSLPFRCSRNDEYDAYQYTGTGPGNCLLIHRNSAAENGLTFTSNGKLFTYTKGSCLRFHCKYMSPRLLNTGCVR